MQRVKIHQRGVQWKQDVVISVLLYTSLLNNTTPIRSTPLSLHPPVMNTERVPQVFTQEPLVARILGLRILGARCFGPGS